jgi:hypothetical protein
MAAGFVMPYRKCDATYALLPVVKVAQDCGLDTSIFVEGPVSESTDFDASLSQVSNIFKWLRQMDTVVFSEPTTEEVMREAKQANVKTVLFFLWDTLTEETEGRLKWFDVIVCPTKCSADLLHKKHPGKVVYVPFDAAVHLTRPDYAPSKNKAILWPIEGSQAANQDMDFISLLSPLLKDFKDLYLTVLHTGGLTATFLRRLNRIMGKYEHRIAILYSNVMSKNRMTYGRHDFVVWPTTAESVGLVGHCALSMSTPCVTFDHPVTREIVTHGRNGLLVPCDLVNNRCGVPAVVPDWKAFDKSVRLLLNSPGDLARMRLDTHRKLVERRSVFNSTWSTFFQEA